MMREFALQIDGCSCVPALQDYHQQYLEKGGQNASKGAWLADGRCLYHPADFRIPAWRVCVVPLFALTWSQPLYTGAIMFAVALSTMLTAVGNLRAGATDRIRCYG